MSFLKRNSIVIFFLCWFLVNLLQAGNTELFDDEAYYWVYSKFLAWGYFDHPPMIALLVKAGYFLFHNELGVRLFVTVLSTATLIIIYDLLPQKNKKLFFAIACSLAILQIGGILAVPDIPLCFFTAFFFWLYRKFLNKASFINALMLGLGMALMLYSKYHGVLIILFTLASNIKLLRQPLAYVAVFFAALLFFPHLLWQYNHGFPSVQYHLFERGSSGYEIYYTTDYLLGQISVAGPIMGWLLIWQSFKYKPVDLFERALKFSLLGFYGFFLLMTLKGNVEANWTIPALVPLIIISHQALLNNKKWKNILWKSVPFTLSIVLAARIYMMLDISPISWMPKDEFHKNKEWTSVIKEKAGDLPVVFIDSYQKASKYWFYTGMTSFSLNTYLYRRNNYNFWPIENSLQGKPVYAVVYKDSTWFNDIIEKTNGVIRGKKIDSFYSHSNIDIVLKNKLVSSADKLSPCTVNIFISGKNSSQLNSRETLFSSLFVFAKDTVTTSYEMIAEPAYGLWKMSSKENILLPKGEYVARLTIPSVIPNLPTLNSTIYKLKVE